MHQVYKFTQMVVLRYQEKPHTISDIHIKYFWSELWKSM